MKHYYAFGLSLICAAGACGAAPLVAGGAETDGANDIGQTYEEPSVREVALSVYSGPVRAPDGDGRALGDLEPRSVQVPVWSRVIEVDDTDWIRLYFGDVVLAHSTEQTRQSYLRITSLADGYEQYLDADALQDWGNSTAYFNGNAVRVEIMASPNASAQFNSVRIIRAQVTDHSTDRSICFSVDDRVLSYDNRDARLMPVGCTAWLFSDHGSRMLTASHCSPGGGDVIQFNVPLSSSGGSPRNPPPQDQYPVDNSSVQRSSNIFIGNDWAYFGVFDNTDTGMSPGQSYGVHHDLAASPPSSDGRPIRITGYGSTTSPVPASWYLVQKTHVGPLVSLSGNVVRYQTDTSGGNSGSAILDDNNQTAIGIHTNAGCHSGGGSNQGTSLFNSDLQNALANPRGVCLPRDIQASLLFEPTHIDPQGGDVVTLVIDNLQGHTVVGTPTMYVDAGGGAVPWAMTQTGPNTYEGVFASYACGSTLSYSFAITDEEGTVVTVPESGSFSTVALDELTIAFADDFENDLGWSRYATDGASGGWLRTVPANHGLGDPPSDADGSGKCYVTSNNFGVDVDNGSVVLLSPLTDLTGLENPVLRVAAWMTGTAPDSMVIEFTDNAGISWATAKTLTSTNGWEDLEFNLGDFIVPNNAFRMRVTVTDAGPNTTVEGGIDAFKISSEVCLSGCAADLNGDGVLDFFDISAFINAYSGMDPIADFNGDGSFDFFDVSAFLAAFSAGCP